MNPSSASAAATPAPTSTFTPVDVPLPAGGTQSSVPEIAIGLPSAVASTFQSKMWLGLPLSFWTGGGRTGLIQWMRWSCQLYVDPAATRRHFGAALGNAFAGSFVVP